MNTFTDSGNRFGSFVFESTSQVRADQWPTPARQDEFKADFSRELSRLDRWAADRQWPPLPAPKLQVVVSDRFKISRSLVPAWSGNAGHMEFPAWRVSARKAAIAHELVHVFFPNGNRFLAEGLAVYLQAEIGGNPAFPNFGRPLHELVRELLQEMVPGFSRGDPASLEQIRLAELDKIATPGPLVLSVGQDFYGEEPRGQARIYPIAGSFVQFLVETRGLEKFREIYLKTPLVPLTQDAGLPDRWKNVYNVSLAALECEWKIFIARHDAIRNATPLLVDDT
jgi:hypothetical protein